MPEVVQLYKDKEHTLPINPVVTADSITIGGTPLATQLETLTNGLNKSYIGYHYGGSSLVLTGEWSHDEQITVSGQRPVFCAASFCNNGSGAGSWVTLGIKRDGNFLCTQTNVNASASYNNPGALVYLDFPPIGTHTYTICIKIGSGSNIDIAESNPSTYGPYEGPNLVVFEI